jgi:hypothetical protein
MPLGIGAAAAIILLGGELGFIDVGLGVIAVALQWF